MTANCVEKKHTTVGIKQVDMTCKLVPKKRTIIVIKLAQVSVRPTKLSASHYTNPAVSLPLGDILRDVL